MAQALESNIQTSIENTLKNLTIWPEMKTYFLSYGRLVRSQFFYTAIKSFNPVRPVSDQALLELATSIELFQTFLLIHDDIVDHAHLRRGGPSLQALIGVENALVVGDLIYTLALQKVSENNGLSIEIRHTCMSSLLKVARLTGMGQLSDQNCEFLKTSNDILKMYENKTGFYSIYLPLKWALVVSNKNLDQSSEQILMQLSKNFGQAYQLIDDLENLGLSSHSGFNAKDLTNDYAQKKRTLIWAELSTKKNQEWDFSKPFDEYLAEIKTLGLYEELSARAQTLFREALASTESLFLKQDLDGPTDKNLLIQKFTEIYEPRIDSLI